MRVCVCVCVRKPRREQNPFLTSPPSSPGAPLLMPFLAGSWKFLITNWVILGRGRERDAPHLAAQRAALRPSPPAGTSSRAGPGSPLTASRSARAGKNEGQSGKGICFSVPWHGAELAGQDQPPISCFQSLSHPFRCAEGNRAPWLIFYFIIRNPRNQECRHWKIRQLSKISVAGLPSANRTIYFAYLFLSCSKFWIINTYSVSLAMHAFWNALALSCWSWGFVCLFSFWRRKSG